MKLAELIETLRVCSDGKCEKCTMFTENTGQCCSKLIRAAADSLELLRGKSADGRWVSIADGPPDKSGDFYVRTLEPVKGGGFVKRVRVATYTDAFKEWMCDGVIVTHWAPVPAPPPGEKYEIESILGWSGEEDKK